MRDKSNRSFEALVAAVAWFVLLLQFYLSIRMSIDRGQGAAHGVAMYFSFFTVLTNIIVAIVSTAPLLMPDSRVGQFCSRIDTIAGVAVNIALVSVTYNLLLRNIWNPQGWQLIADTLLHDVVPILFVAFAWLCARSGSASYVARLRWAAWPIVYFAFAMVRGAVSGFYPYPFLNASQIGYGGVLIYAIGIVVGYLAIAGILYALDRIVTPKLARP